ncbi:MAG: hypothetical protein GY811_20785 [Myxococcales bacterium]|nr:hypothetical protein [Myxococcales bacterium]
MLFTVTRSFLLLSIVALFGSAAACAAAGGGSDTPDAFPTRTDSGSNGPDAGGQRADASGPSACEQAVAALRFDFEGSAQGFVHGPMPIAAASGVNWTFDHWEQGAATASTTCPSGQECFGTNLDGNYIQCQRAYLVSPPIDLSACAAASREVSVHFKHNYHFWSGNEGGAKYDGGLIEISADGSNWQSATVLYPGTIAINPDIGSSACIEKDSFYVHEKDGYVGTSLGWLDESFEIPFALSTVTFQMRFVYASGVSSQTSNELESMAGTEAGWFVDNLRFQ